ncbi:hypothetical protein DDP54_16370 (plasmid) [Cellulomonas sp. WB94]|uniref:hypothetical protein n=1 Tax=Cellulomonas sp. WB94 TaxID=2173174 RepID=UPI000D57858B|nr:hypothetical protein [Cellulomonas sp. WB94]PVU81452.1 hypothetical protein DDP54_16370 [Cellulomonas sp. WB94]
MTPLAWIVVATLVLAVAGLALRSVRRRADRPRPDSSGEDTARAEALAQISRDIERGRSAGHDLTSQQGTFL